MRSRNLRTRSLFILGSGILGTALALGSGTAAWAAPPTETDGLEYVALGDSYAAGLGLGSPTGNPVDCGQSLLSYPNLVAAELGLDLIDVTCSGADTSNIIDTPQLVGTGSDENPVQANALSADTDIVTVSIGGNDLGFTDIIVGCLAGSATGPLHLDPASNCESLFAPGGVDSLALLIAGPVSTGLTNTFAKIHTAAPNAKIFVVGYPALMPDAANTTGGSCYTPTTPNPFPFTDNDVEYLHGVQVALDAAMSSRASTAGATFVSLLADSLDNTPCANNADTFINGFTIGVPGIMHPNADGAAFMAGAVQTAIIDALAAPTITSAAPTSDTLIGDPYSFNITATGFPNPTFSVSAGQLPDGLLLDTTTGEISGTSTLTGLSTFSITAENTVDSVTEEYTISVNQTPAITSTTPPSSGTVGEHFSFTISGTGFPAPQFAIASGALPDGITLDTATGEISGEPTAAGTFTFSISATNAAGSVVSSEFTITVAEAAATDPGSSDAPTVPTLVSTGADSLLPIGLAGMLALLAGAGVLLTRHRAES